MADAWNAHAASRAVLEEASAAIGRDVVRGCRDKAALATTEFVQPAIVACDMAAFRVLEATGMVFVGAGGHSLGEFAALVAAGVLDLADALRIVIVRGRAMQAAGVERPGTMTALLGIGTEEARALCDEARGDEVLLVANENSPQQVVISGSIPAIERAEALAAGRRVRAVRLNVAGAFHSLLMEPAVEPLSAAIDAAAFRPPRFPVAANVTGELESGSRGAPRPPRTPRRVARAMGAVREGARRGGRGPVRRGRAGRRPHQARQTGGAGRAGGSRRLARSRGGTRGRWLERGRRRLTEAAGA